MTLTNYFIALFLTLLIELIIAYFIGYKTKKTTLTIVLINLITHPTFWFFLYLSLAIFQKQFSFLSIVFIEFVIVFVESVLLSYALRKKYQSMFILSFAMNASSFLFGVFLKFLNVLQ